MANKNQLDTRQRPAAGGDISADLTPEALKARLDKLLAAVRRLEFTSLPRLRGRKFNNINELSKSAEKTLDNYSELLIPNCQRLKDNFRSISLEDSAKNMLFLGKKIEDLLKEFRELIDLKRSDIEARQKLELEKQEFIKRQAEELRKAFGDYTHDGADALHMINEIIARAGYGDCLVVKTKVPTEAPNGELYVERNKSENAPDFIRRVYSRWLTGEFTRTDLRVVDPKAIIGLSNWESEHKQRADINLPTLTEFNTRMLQEQAAPANRTERIAIKRLSSKRQRASRKDPGEKLAPA